MSCFLDWTIPDCSGKEEKNILAQSSKVTALTAAAPAHPEPGLISKLLPPSLSEAAQPPCTAKQEPWLTENMRLVVRMAPELLECPALCTTHPCSHELHREGCAHFSVHLTTHLQEPPAPAWAHRIPENPELDPTGIISAALDLHSHSKSPP